VRTNSLKPQTFISNVLADAEKALKTANKGNDVLSKADIGRLPTQLKDVVDDFKAAGNERVKTADVLGALQASLENGLASSVAAGEFVPGDLTADLASLVGFSQTGLQVAQMIEARAAKAPESFSDAAQEAQAALAQADFSVTSQVSTFKALQQAARVAKVDAPDTAQLLDGIAKDRAKLLRKVVDTTVKTAEQAVKADGSLQNKQQLAGALQAAVDVTKAINPRSSKLKTLAKKQTALGVDAPQAQQAKQPFFARFLEQQNRGDEVHVGATPDDGGGMMVTMKYPSDNEDGGGNVGDGGDAGDITTAKFPSDAEDSGDGGVGDVVTEKYPSDAEDGGDVGDGGGIFTTLKYPSDNEDGGGDVGGGRPGDNLTLKFPSDAEDGGSGPGDIFVTLKFPSDNEDGGGGVELLPEIRPEIRPEVIIEIAPEVAPGGQSNALKAERRIVKAAYHGYDQIEHEMGEIDRLLRSARIAPDLLEELNLARSGLKAVLNGGGAIQTRINEINQLFRTALIDEPGTKKLQAELGMLGSLKSLMDGYKFKADMRERQRDARPEKPIEIRTLRLAYDGQPAVEKRLGELKTRLQITDLPAHKRMHANVEYNALKALANGGDQLEQRISDIKNLQISAGMTPELAQELDMELRVLGSLLDVTKGFEKRMNDIDNPGPIPPQPPPPEIRPEIRPEIIVEIRPEIQPTTGLAVDIEQNVVKAAYYGMETVLAEAKDLERTLQVARLSPEAYLRTSVSATCMRAFYDGAKGVDKAIKDAEFQLTRRGPMDGQRRAQLELTIEVLRNVQKSNGQIEDMSKKASQQGGPADDIVSKHLTVMLAGGQEMLDRVVELSRQSGPFTDLGVETMKLLYEGGPALEKELAKMRALEPQLGGTQEVLTPFYIKKDVLEQLVDAMKVFEKRLNDLGPGPIPPQPPPIVEVAPEVRPEIIVEIAPDVLGGSDDE
jgi:hypothetical protein